jgi:Protein of unknown function (DUF4236)
MGIYFRRRRKLGPLSVNLSKRGVGLSGGLGRGRLSVGPSGRRFSLRLLRGLSYRRKL